MTIACWTGLVEDDCVGCANFSGKRCLAAKCGRAAVTIGDPDTAANTAVTVPGLRQNIHSYIGNSDALHIGEWAIIILDEAQNCTPGQMKMCLTRL